MPLCDQTDLEAILQTVIPDPNSWIPKLIQLVQGNIESVIGTPLDEDTYVDTVDPLFGKSVWLPHWPVTAITSVVEDGTTLTAGTDFYLADDGAKGELVRLSGSGYGSFWEPKPQSIVVSYTAGFATVADVPFGLRALAARVTARAFQAGATFAGVDALGVQSEQIGDYQESFDVVGLRSVTAAADLTAGERVQARRYGRRLTAIPIV